MILIGAPERVALWSTGENSRHGPHFHAVKYNPISRFPWWEREGSERPFESVKLPSESRNERGASSLPAGAGMEKVGQGQGNFGGGCAALVVGTGKERVLSSAKSARGRAETRAAAKKNAGAVFMEAISLAHIGRWVKIPLIRCLSSSSPASGPELGMSAARIRGRVAEPRISRLLRV